MATIIKKKKFGAVSFESDHHLAELERLRELLPKDLCLEIEQAVAKFFSGEKVLLEEIRLRSGRRVFLTLGTKFGKRNLTLSKTLLPSELAEVFERMCGGSLYAYGESLCKGYISLGGGIRVGVCGHASAEGGRICGIYDVSSLNIRIPHRPLTLAGELLSRVSSCVENGEGVLIYSPPAQGKTTLLRSLCRELSSGENARRVVVVDSRDELAPISDAAELSLDVLSGYPKAEGIYIATAYMNPEVIVCDEIGASDDVSAILEAQNCGVPLIATAHGADIRSVLRRPSLRTLYKAAAFDLYVGIAINGHGGFEHSFCTRKEASELFEDHRDACSFV